MLRKHVLYINNHKNHFPNIELNQSRYSVCGPDCRQELHTPCCGSAEVNTRPPSLRGIKYRISGPLENSVHQTYWIWSQKQRKPSRNKHCSVCKCNFTKPARKELYSALKERVSSVSTLRFLSNMESCVFVCGFVLFCFDLVILKREKGS